MANKDAAFGLRPLRRLDGSAWTGATQKMLVEDNYGVALFVGDPVIITGAAGSDDGTGHFNVASIATTGDGNRIAGVIVSVDPDPDALGRIYIPANTGGYINVCTDPFVVFAVQDNAGATLTSASVGANAVIVGGAGSTITGLSGWELAAATTPAADASYQLQIIGIVNSPNNIMGDNVIWEVIISNHLYLGGSAVANEGALGI